jgi:hypothetical protein
MNASPGMKTDGMVAAKWQSIFMHGAICGYGYPWLRIYSCFWEGDEMHACMNVASD